MKIWKIVILIWIIFFIIWLYLGDNINHKENLCDEYYRIFQLQYNGIVTKKWIDKGTNLHIDLKNMSDEILWDGRSPYLVDSAEVGDSIFKQKNSMLCTLKKKNNKVYFFTYYILSKKSIPCPDTNRFKNMK